MARDVPELKRAESVQDAQYSISEAAHCAEDLDQLYRDIHRTICRLFTAESFCVTRHDPASGALSYPYLADEQVARLESGSMPQDAALARIIRQGSGMLLHANDVTGAGATQPPPQCPPNWLGMP